MAYHSTGIGLSAAKVLEGCNGLEHGHAASVQRAAADRARGAQQFGLEREVDDLGDLGSFYLARRKPGV